MKRNKTKKQTFYYNGNEYQYRILPGSLLRFERETGRRVESTIYRGTADLISVLYYCVCWGVESVSRNGFVEDWKQGRVLFRPGAREYNTLEISRLIKNAIIRFKREGKWI